jgi:colicin import membrane protein
LWTSSNSFYFRIFYLLKRFALISNE